MWGDKTDHRSLDISFVTAFKGCHRRVFLMTMLNHSSKDAEDAPPLIKNLTKDEPAIAEDDVIGPRSPVLSGSSSDN